MMPEELRQEEVRKQSATFGSEAAAALVNELGQKPGSIEAALQSASATLITMSYAVVKRAKGQKAAEEWLAGTFAVMRAGLQDQGLDTAYTIARKPK